MPNANRAAEAANNVRAINFMIEDLSCFPILGVYTMKVSNFGNATIDPWMERSCTLPLFSIVSMPRNTTVCKQLSLKREISGNGGNRYFRLFQRKSSIGSENHPNVPKTQQDVYFLVSSLRMTTSSNAALPVPPNIPIRTSASRVPLGTRSSRE